jgi:hypothetical protein
MDPDSVVGAMHIHKRIMKEVHDNILTTTTTT